MPKYIVLNSNIVENIIVADTLEIAQEATNAICVLVPNNDFIVYVGDLYDGVTFTPDRNTSERYTPFKPIKEN